MTIKSAPTIEEDARNYVDLINGSANGWGQHICKRTGYVSHWVLKIGNDIHGEINFQNAIDARFKVLAKENQS